MSPLPAVQAVTRPRSSHYFTSETSSSAPKGRSKIPLSLALITRPGRLHHQEIIFHAKLTRPMHRDFPLTPRHSSSERRHKMRVAGGRAGSRGTSFTDELRMSEHQTNQKLMIRSRNNSAVGGDRRTSPRYAVRRREGMQRSHPGASLLQ